MRTLRLFVDHKRAKAALNTAVPHGATVYVSGMKWVLANGDEVWFQTVDMDRLRGMEWNHISYEEVGPLDGETVARLEAMKRPARVSDRTGQA